MRMPGGGPFKLAPGQITDDSELAMCLMWGLTYGNQSKNAEANSYVFPNPTIAFFYANWIASNPFDIGITTKNALGSLQYNQSAQVAK